MARFHLGFLLLWFFGRDDGEEFGVTEFSFYGDDGLICCGFGVMESDVMRILTGDDDSGEGMVTDMVVFHTDATDWFSVTEVVVTVAGNGQCKSIAFDGDFSEAWFLSLLVVIETGGSGDENPGDFSVFAGGDAAERQDLESLIDVHGISSLRGLWHREFAHTDCVMEFAQVL